MTDQPILGELTADIVANYVANNPVQASDLPKIILEVHSALSTLGNEPAEPDRPTPPVSIKRSVTDDYIVCLEDGKRFKSLKRHLRTYHDMTPAQYRERWGLSRDYPMTAPGYAKRRSELAKEIGLGKKDRNG